MKLNFDMKVYVVKNIKIFYYYDTVKEDIGIFQIIGHGNKSCCSVYTHKFILHVKKISDGGIKHSYSWNIIILKKLSVNLTD